MHLGVSKKTSNNTLHQLRRQHTRKGLLEKNVQQFNEQGAPFQHTLAQRRNGVFRIDAHLPPMVDLPDHPGQQKLRQRVAIIFIMFWAQHLVQKG